MKSLLLLLGLLWVQSASSLLVAAKPNIILILADDLGAKELSCYGSKLHQTPNLDKMAAEGVRFETHFAMPLCTPTRVCLMTGQYGFHNGYLGMGNKAFTPQKQSPKAEMGNHFTHADLMKSAGYATAQAGKWQLSGTLPTLVRDCGFDEYRMWAYDHNLPAGVTHPAHEKGGNACRYWHPSIIENGKYLPTKAEDYGPDFFNDFVIDFARKHKTEPFFIYYTSVLTHSPHLETPDPANPGKRWPATFKSNLEYLDHLMGKLLASLKTEGLDDNTVVIFIGDNGTGGDGKATLTELGARTPCIIRGPGLGVKAGVVSKAVADLTDIMPTLAEFSGATLPKDVPFDGHSLVPVLRGEREKHRDWIYSHLDDGRVLRDTRWLLEIDKGGKGEKFFDCGESRNGTGYKDVTNSTDPEVKAAREKFTSILAGMPEPKPHEGMAAKEMKKGKADKKAKGMTKTGETPASTSTPPPASMKDREVRYAFRDQNKDGRIDHDEFMKTASGKDPTANEARFKKMDRNQDAGVSKEEFLNEK